MPTFTDNSTVTSIPMSTDYLDIHLVTTHNTAAIAKRRLDVLNEKLEDQQPLQYKYNEDINMSRIQEYINGTYGQHYVGNGDIQTVDFWESLGTLETTSRDTAIKYLARYGKKEGRNPKDLLKAVHYILLMMYAADKEKNNVT